MNINKINKIADSVKVIIQQVAADEKEKKHLLQVDDEYKQSAANLINYLSLRSFDIRKLQRKLGYLGMSRLARSEAHVKASLKSTLEILNHLKADQTEVPVKRALSIKKAEKLLARHTERLLGKEPHHRRLRIMVTMPAEAADDYQLVEKMVESGMDCSRINCAHDDAEVWSKMIANIKKAEKKLKKKVTITMDLGGPKIRTEEIDRGRKKKTFEPKKSDDGEVLKHAVVRLVPSGNTKQKSKDLPVPDEWLSHLSVSDTIQLIRESGESFELKVTELSEKGVIAECPEVVVAEAGDLLKGPHGEAKVSHFSGKKQSLSLSDGDCLIVCKSSSERTKFKQKGICSKVVCSLPEVLKDVRIGDRVYFDDGEIEAKVLEKSQQNLLVKVVHARSGKSKLKVDKGINFPDSNLTTKGLTDKDREDLVFVAKHADAVNFSFVNTPEDVVEMISALEHLGVKNKLGLILKIETKRGYDYLTRILLEAMKTSKVGVMIARGDLAIETGWERIGSIQKEMLTICNAAHVPVVWATQVLENLAKEGLPSRSEITDAVNASKADCVMLNKGPHIIEAIKLLDQIIRSTEAYQDKNAPMLPKLKKIAVKRKNKKEKSV